MKLVELKTGETVFIDANIFLYHFTGVSEECKEFLRRCEDRDLFGVTGLTILTEVCHFLMIAEAIKRKLIPSQKPTVYLQKKPQIIKGLSEYSGQVLSILSWGIRVINPSEDIMIRSQIFRSQFGLLTNDSFIPVYMQLANTDKLATNDQAFNRIPTIHTFSPHDINER